MKKILFVIAALLGGCSSAPSTSTEPQEWSFTKSGSVADNEHVVTIKGHGKICYVFVEDWNGRNAVALLWCEN